MTGRSDHSRGRGELAESDRHRLLADPRRRLLLDVLADRDGPVELEALAEAVAGREGGASVARVAVSLHHCHLPLLDEFDVVEYRPERNRVERIDWPSGDR